MNIKNIVSASLCVVFLTSCESDEQLNAQTSLNASQPPRRAIIGERLYQRYCAGCHGETGEGDGLHSFTLNPSPVNLADSTVTGIRSDDDLFAVISDGGPAVGKSVEMPRWKDVLKKNEVEDVIIYIRTLPEKQASDSLSQ